MVSQKLVQEVMEKLNRPCNTRDIATYMIENKLSTIASDIKPDISNVLNIMRKWYVVDKYPDLHGMDSNKWYLVVDGKPHDSKNCKYCKGIYQAYNNNTSQYMLRSTSRKVRLVNDKDHLAEGEFNILDRRW